MILPQVAFRRSTSKAIVEQGLISVLEAGVARDRADVGATCRRTGQAPPLRTGVKSPPPPPAELPSRSLVNRKVLASVAASFSWAAVAVAFVCGFPHLCLAA